MTPTLGAPLAEGHFDDYRAQRNLEAGRLAAWLVIVLMPAGVVLDVLTNPEHLAEFLAIRCAASLLSALVLVFSYTRNALRYVYPIGLIPPLLAALGVEFMIQRLEGYSSPYYAGLNLCILGFSITVYWRMRETMLACGLVVLMWLIPALMRQESIRLAPFSNNLYFLCLSSLIAIFSAESRYRLIRKEFESRKKLQELDEMKSRFFANVSHELRTPLTLALGPLEQVMAQSQDDANRERLAMVHRNQLRLLRLINDLLDFSKLEAGRMSFIFRRENVVSVLNDLLAGFQLAATERGIAVRTEIPVTPIWLYLDTEKIEKIVANLLSNAFKFTPRGGQIDIGLTEEADRVAVFVSDTGIGIPADKHNVIFERFAQVDPSSTRRYAGTGIGLALVKEYVEAHGGNVEVKSEEGKGSTFTVHLRKGNAHLPADSLRNEDVLEDAEGYSIAPNLNLIDVQEVVREEQRDDADSHRLRASARRTYEAEEDFSQDARERVERVVASLEARSTVLVVDDTADMRDYVSNLLKPYYEVITARDGLEGLDMARRYIPDVIVSDVMMPRMDGEEFCRVLKEDKGRVGRIPIILLTARTDMQRKLEGLQRGADDYLFKPFHVAELLLRVRNLQRERRKEQALYLTHASLVGDLRAAREVQQSMLPNRIIEGFIRVESRFMPRDEVGGDIYDLTQLGEGHWRLLLIDATDHGVQGALRAATILGEYAQLKTTELSPGEILESLNTTICGKYRRHVSCCGVCIDLRSEREGEVRIDYSQGGGAPITVASRRGLERLESTKGMILGIARHARYRTFQRSMRRGERLFLYTDGIEEQLDAQKRMFGHHGLDEAFLNAFSERSLKGALDRLIHELDRFRGVCEQEDDVTVLGIEVS